MPDEIDRDQEFNEQRLDEMIEQSRFKPGPAPSLFHCRLWALLNKSDFG